jgi:hypothetical protein
VAKKVLTTLSFIGGRLRLPGEEVDFDDQNPDLVIPAASTPLANMTDEEIEAYLRHKRGLNKAPGDSVNLADATEANTGRQFVPIADVTVRSEGSTRPQGAPAGSIEHNGSFVAPAAPDASAAVDQFVPEGAAVAPGTNLPQLDHDGNGEPGGSLTKAEIVQALKDRGESPDASKTKAELQAQLSAPPAA